MAIVTLPSIVPLSSSMRIMDIVGHIRALLNELDAQRIQDMSIRTHIRVATSHLAELLSVAKSPEYGITWKLSLEGSPTPPTHLGQATRDPITEFYYCNLQTLVVPVAPVTANAEAAYPEPSDVNPSFNAGVVPMNLLRKITTISAAKNRTTQVAVPNVWQGNVQETSLDELSGLSNDYNSQWRHSVCYAHHGSKILFYFGTDISTSATFADNIYNLPATFTLYGYRKPLLDNLKAPTEADSGWNSLVDIPDEHIHLVELMVQKACYQQLNKQVPPEVDNSIIQLRQTITQSLQEELMMEAQERQKVKKGFNTR